MIITKLFKKLKFVKKAIISGELSTIKPDVINLDSEKAVVGRDSLGIFLLLIRLVEQCACQVCAPAPGTPAHAPRAHFPAVMAARSAEAAAA